MADCSEERLVVGGERSLRKAALHHAGWAEAASVDQIRQRVTKRSGSAGLRKKGTCLSSRRMACQ